MQEFRIYYESLEQAAHFILPLLEVHKDCEISLVKRQKNYSAYSRKVAPIIYWKDPDILISTVQNGVEFPLIQVEFSTAEFAADHELQRFDGLVASIQSECIYAKISPSKSKSNKKNHGGDTKFNHNIPYAVALQRYGIVTHHFDWTVEDEKLVVNANFLSCPENLDDFTSLITELIQYSKDYELKDGWLLEFQQKLLAEHEWFRKLYEVLKNTKMSDTTALNSSRTRWDKDEKSLYLKINRFGHAMDPERGMLAFYGSACRTKCSMIFNAESSTWFNKVPKEKEIKTYIEQNGLKTAFDYLHLFSLASGLFRFKEFKEIVGSFRSQTKTTIEIDLTEFIKLYFPKFNKPLKTIFFYSDVWQIRDTKGNIILDLHWEKATDKFDFSEFPLLTSLEPYNGVEEDEITYISVHDIFRPNNYIVIAKSYPGSQGDRAILPQKDKGRSQLRVFVDIIAYLPDKHTNLQENKPVFSNKSIQKDIDKLSLFKLNKEYQAALETFLSKYDSKAPKQIKIGVGFWANNRFTVEHIQALNIDDLDYFVYINADRTRWKIFSTGNEQLFSITEGKVNVPSRYKLKKYKAD